MNYLFSKGIIILSRLGDLIQTERLRRELSAKKVAKMNGISEKYLLAVEAGTKIISDDKARKILRKMGLEEHNEAGFTMDAIAATVDLETVQVKQASSDKKERKPVYYNEKSSEEENVTGSIWLDALTSVLKNVPVYNSCMNKISNRLIPIENGKIENANPDKVFFMLVPDDSMRGFRILKDDIVFVVPSASPIDEAIMVVQFNKHISIRKIKKLDAITVLVQSYDREYRAETCGISELKFIGRCVRFEADL